MGANILGYKSALAVVVMLIVSMAGGAVFSSLPGGLFRESVVTVSDLQYVVAQILTNSTNPGAPLSDMNRDGRVDILDLQSMLAEAQHHPVRSLPASNTPTHQAILSEKTEWFAVRLEHHSPALLFDDTDLSSPILLVRDGQWTGLFHYAERYPFSLTPHAPPRFA